MNGRDTGRGQSIVLGVLRLARFDARGLAQFGDSVPAFLSSLAPLVAFPLVGALLMGLNGQGLAAADELLATLCALLAPPVLSEALAAAWHREAAWLRYATAYNWCQWVIPMVAVLLLLVLGLLTRLGLPDRVAVLAMVFGLLAYALALHWFLARRALGLSAVKATLLVIGVTLGTVILVLGPRLLALAAGPQEG